MAFFYIHMKLCHKIAYTSLSSHFNGSLRINLRALPENELSRDKRGLERLTQSKEGETWKKVQWE